MGPPPVGHFGPGVPGAAGGYGAAAFPVSGGGANVLSSNSIVSGLLAGALGGFLGFVFSKIQGDSSYSSTADELKEQSGIWTMLIGIGMGSVLAAWSSATSGAWEQVVKRAALGAAIGAGMGFIAGYLGQTIYQSMLEDISYYATESQVMSKVMQARVVGWGLFGAILGLGIGMLFGPKRVLNGLIGGAVGGAVGGFIFQKIAESATSNTGPQFFGIVTLGLAIGLAVGIMDRLFRQFWLQGVSGPLRGREVILFKERTTIGSGANCDIMLANDPSTMPFHCTIVVSGQALYVEPAAPVRVNGVDVVMPAALGAGQLLEMGRSSFTIGQRAYSGAPPPMTG